MVPSLYLSVQSYAGLQIIVFATCPRTGKYLAFVVGTDGDQDAVRRQLVYQVIELDENHGLYIAHGSFLSWMECYVDGIVQGVYDTISPERAISMFPNDGPYTSHSSSRGIDIYTSAIAALEASAESGVWIYRIKLVYIGGADAPSSCQLTRRRWLIK